MPEAVDWATARRVATWVGARTNLPAPYRPDVVRREFDELTAEAELLVAAHTGFVSTSGPARARVTDRAGWVDANIASFQRLLGPQLARLDPARPLRNTPVGAPLALLSRSATGAQLGTVLGWMSTRVLGQYDLLLTEDAVDDQDLVYYVGPNVVALEQTHGFDPRQFRLWLALHEVTHRCQFTAVPWMREYFVSLVEDGVRSLEPDPAQMRAALHRAVTAIRAGQNPLEENGALGLVATEEQLVGLQRIQALMSLLEGHGDVTMDRAGAGVIEDAPRFSAVLRQRRAESRGLARLLQQLLGIEAKLRQYAQGERFIAAVEEHGGTDALAPVWLGPENLPTMDEIRHPERWLERMAPSALAAP